MSETIQGAPQFKGKVYGIELEIEADGLYAVEEKFNENTEEYEHIEPDVPAGWLREQEDSIQGVELISDGPYPFEQSVKNIERVFDDIKRQGFNPIRTPRGSTHVHANVADLTWEQMRSFVMACAWAEPVLIELAGKGRKGNLFAQSYENTPIGWSNVIESCRRGEFAGSNVDTHYMATSFHPMTYLGSVEFRMGPSARCAEDAIRWLMCIDTVVAAGREDLITAEKAPPFVYFLLSKFPDEKKARLLQKGERAALEVWYAMNEPYVKPEVKPRKKKSPLDVNEFIDEFVNMSWGQVSAVPTVPVINSGQLISYSGIFPTSDPAIPEGYMKNPNWCHDPDCNICPQYLVDPNYVNSNNIGPAPQQYS